ncbi:cilia- and flagella-associated protein 144 [Hyla sarda]|uniref:cilia- and flagella-associated protein 144 n=1 Tax=Hyla sarda TaxID=327740 RepID=UPI0024C26842|nr:cilia- and flagella-associated protein 144 [Hyla sarda]
MMAAAATGQQREKAPRDEVSLNAIHRETIRKENRTQRLITEFSINPNHRMHAVTGKPMAWHENQNETADENFLTIIHHAALEPTKKYSEPQTTNQEIGWITRPLISMDRTDGRLHHHRQKTEITAYMESAWKLKEQSVNLQ